MRLFGRRILRNCIEVWLICTLFVITLLLALGETSVAFETVERWICILENLHYCFRIAPYGLPRLRAMKKEKKLYMWDWSLCEDQNATCLLDRITEVSIARAQLYTKAGADIVHLGDDIGTQHGPVMGLELWREWLKTRLKKVVDAAKAINPDVLISYHSCGDIRIFLEDLVEVGIDVLNPIQPECMDFQQVYDQIGDRMSFWGTIVTQQLLPFGTVIVFA